MLASASSGSNGRGPGRAGAFLSPALASLTWSNSVRYGMSCSVAAAGIFCPTNTQATASSSCFGVYDLCFAMMEGNC
ncbi:hypothetical protein PF007_g32317 [Phytophthora fragariae]|uniref:Uncharacterized protein n=1 Tax=Phytophthora fragariae TaxID=53985 RepID=A0A6A3PJB5_9STRA|nr:hypothetical protein PF003_g27865 [Phytophthora fragariae]KAE9055433.1 hypothetical protein PF007_g32317 [Phytophthora fragariae]